MTKEELNELGELCSLTTTTKEQYGRIEYYHRKYINNKYPYCSSCPDAVRNVFHQLKQWFNSNEGNLNRVISHKEAMEQAKKKELVKDVTPVKEDKDEVNVKVVKTIEIIKDEPKKRRGRPKTKKDGNK